MSPRYKYSTASQGILPKKPLLQRSLAEVRLWILKYTSQMCDESYWIYGKGPRKSLTGRKKSRET